MQNSIIDGVRYNSSLFYHKDQYKFYNPNETFPIFKSSYFTGKRIDPVSYEEIKNGNRIIIYEKCRHVIKASSYRWNIPCYICDPTKKAFLLNKAKKKIRDNKIAKIEKFIVVLAVSIILGSVFWISDAKAYFKVQ